MRNDPVDCVIIGAGPAGLTAAIYLSRFLLTLRIFDDGASRCALIPRTRNHAGYPGGVSGKELLRRMRDQAAEFGAHVTYAHVETINRDADGLFRIHFGAEQVASRAVLLATGIVNNRPRITDADHELAVAQGALRYCPICDGYEVTDKNVGVIGTRTHGFNEAKFIRMYTSHITLIAPEAEHVLTDEERRFTVEMGITLADGPCGQLRLEDRRIVAPTARGDLHFDSVYPALGSAVRSDLAAGLGANVTGEQCLIVDSHQRTSIPGLYAAGDVVRGLDQISHAMGEAGVAATTIRNDLAQTRILAR